MTGYQIDEVRELFTSDMDRFMRDLDLRSEQLRNELSELRRRASVIESTYGSFAVSFHAIAGTSALLAVKSAHALAEHLENMVHELDASVRVVLVEGDRLDRRRLSCEHGIEALRHVIADELAGKRPEAAARSASAIDQLDRALNEPRLTPMVDAPSDEHLELLEVFREEMIGARADVQAQLDTLSRGADAGLGERGAALSRLAAVLHMMKGSAASVGEDALAAELRDLHDVVEGFLDLGELPDATVARQLRERMRTTQPGEAAPAILARAPSSGAAGTADTEGRSAAELFRTEARHALRQGRAVLEDPAREPVSSRRELAGIFHHLHGSALVTGLPDIASYIAELERLAQQHGVLERAQLDRLASMIERTAADESGHPPEAMIARPRPRPRREAVPLRVTGELWDAFAEEATELIEALEQILRGLESTDQPGALITSLLGTIHTLKGAANTVGLMPMGRELHVVETLLEALHTSPTPERRAFVLTRLSETIDRLRRNLGLAKQGEVECAAEALEHDLVELANLTATGKESPSQSWLSPQDSAWVEPTAAIAPGRSRHGSSELRPATESPAEVGGERRFIRVGADKLDALMAMVGELVVSRSRVNADLGALASLHDAQGQRQRRLVEVVETFTEQAEYANLGGVARRQRRVHGGPHEFGALEFDVYEEVHVLARRLEEAASDVDDTSSDIAEGLSRLSASAEELGGIVSSLQSQINRARMVPLEALFSRLALPARDAAERERKQVDVVLEGSDVVIDKAIADALYAPMLHLVRNAAVHGIESTGHRRTAHKPERGVITLRARQEAGEIVVSVGDDGAGIDTAALYRAGVARGLIDRGISVDAPEVLELIFAAGLSTTASPNDVAGRGMGGDVVRRTVQRLGGSIRVLNQPGLGVTFVLRLPVTLAITRAIIIRQGAQLFGVPLLFVERILGLDDFVAVPGDEHRIRHGDDLLGVVRILPGADAPFYLRCAVGGRQLAIAADSVIAHDEIVVKRLGPVLDGHPLFAGASQRGDGELALILDMQGLAERHAQAIRPAQPFARQPSQAASDERRPEPGAPAAASGRRRVLFVDDSLSVRKVAEQTLRKLGFEVVTASDGREALDRLRDERFALVFTDLEMPRMHGYELIQQMRYVPAYRDIPIVVVSSRSGEKHVQKALEAGAAEYLTKPFSAETLGAALKRLLREPVPEAT